MVIFWRTGVRQETGILVKLSPLGVAWGGPGGGTAAVGGGGGGVGGVGIFLYSVYMRERAGSPEW